VLGGFHDKRDRIAERERALREIADIADITVPRCRQLVARGAGCASAEVVMLSSSISGSMPG